MDWIKQWTKETLADVPEGRYRRRMEKELRDHLETQYRALTEAGRTEDEAQAEALRVMGEPETLRGEYQAAWRRRPEAVVRAGLGWLGAVIVGGMLLYAAFGVTLTPLSVLAEFIGGWDFASGVYQFLSGTLAFWVPFTAVAAFLRLCLRNYRYRGVLISAGLLAIWMLGTVCLVLSNFLVKEHYQYHPLPPGWPDRLALFYRDMQHSNAPWITPGYHLMNIGSCVFLGWLFGRRDRRGEKPAAA